MSVVSFGIHQEDYETKHIYYFTEWDLWPMNIWIILKCYNQEKCILKHFSNKFENILMQCIAMQSHTCDFIQVRCKDKSMY